MHFDSVTGWVRGVRHCPSPNFNLRPQGDVVSLLVIHNISLPPGQFGTGKVGVVCGRGRNPTLRLWPTIFSGKIDVFPGDRRSRLISSMTSVAPA